MHTCIADGMGKTFLPVSAILVPCGRPHGEALRVGWKRYRAAYAVPAGLRRPHTFLWTVDASAYLTSVAIRCCAQPRRSASAKLSRSKRRRCEGRLRAGRDEECLAALANAICRAVVSVGSKRSSAALCLYGRCADEDEANFFSRTTS